MAPEAYKLGYLDAALDHGVTKEAFAKAILPLLGAGVGAALAPEDERGQGAMLGGLGALGLQSAVLGRVHAPMAAPAPIVPTVPLTQQLKNVGSAAIDQGKSDMMGWLKAPAKQASLDQFKLAIDVGGSIPIPGLVGLGVNLKDRRDRLPGMSRYVPTGTIERGFDYADQGLDPEQVMEMEGKRNNVMFPAVGAGLASIAAGRFAPKSGMGGKILAGLGGAGLGSLYHRATHERRMHEGLEGFEAAKRERYKFPIRRHPTQTANEASPLAVSRGGEV